jgi:hypothetical protein
MQDNMHDWTLLNIRFDWDAGQATAEFLDGKGSRTLVAEGVSALHIPRRLDWGPSASVNSASQMLSPTGTSVLKIEMQSGDVIEISAEAFTTSSTR